MARNYKFEPAEVREIAQNFPDVKRLMIERHQIKQEAKLSTSYTKLEPHLKPKGDIHHPKIHKASDKQKISREGLYNSKLKENSKKIEISFHDNFDKKGLKQMSEWAREMNTEEITIFMEEGYDQVLENREEIIKATNQNINLEQDIRMDVNESKEIFGELESEHEFSSLENKETGLNKKLSEDLKMDTKESQKAFEIEQIRSDFKANVKDLDTDKEPSPSADYE